MRVIVDPDPLLSGNPYLQLYAESLAAAGCQVLEAQAHGDWSDVDILNIHFPDLAAGSRSLLRSIVSVTSLHARVASAHRNGAKVVWTAHNLRSHDQHHRRLEQWSMRRFVRHLDAFTVLSWPQMAAFEAAYPVLRSIPRVVTPHGHFRNYYGRPPKQCEARARLAIPADALVLLALGDLRPYKQTTTLAATFRLTRGSLLRLLVAGRERDATTMEALKAASAEDARIDLRPGWLSDTDLVDHVAASDVVCVPYGSVLNSSVALLGLSLGRRVLMPDVASARALQEEMGSKWVTVGAGPTLAPADLEACLHGLPRLDEAPLLPSREWSETGRAATDLFRSLRQRVF
jgi:beta-1,4-mannosyltransferase